MDNGELKTLVDAFKAYRDLLNPIQASLSEFALTYNLMSENVEKLNAAFGAEAKDNLEKIYKTLSGQAEKASDLSSRIDNFMRLTSKYAQQIDQMLGIFSKLEDRIKSVNEIEAKAETQLEKLDTLISEKAKNYDLRELNKALDSYNANVTKISEFINKDVAESLMSSQNKLEAMKNGLDGIVKKQRDSDEGFEKLILNYTQSKELLKKIAEDGDVNEAYIFDILDNWAQSRRVKIKK